MPIWGRCTSLVLSTCLVTAQTAVPTEQAIHTLETDLVGPVAISGYLQPPKTLAAEMKRLHVPAVSIAVIHAGQVQWTKAYGIARERGALTTPETLFQAASISKSVTAMAALRLVQEHKLSLDTPIEGDLKSWRIPPNEFTNLRPVTLRELLSNTAGTSGDGFQGYAEGESLPNLEQILAGTKPANSVPVVVEAPPGLAFRYSGGGFLIAQQAMMDVTGEPFMEIMHRLVLAPIGMRNSTFEQPLDSNRVTSAAYPTDGNGHWIHGGPHAYPEMAAGGLWTTPADLARWIISVQRSLADDPQQVLSAEMAKVMITPVQEGYGLGVRVQDHAGSLSFNHDGSNAGYKAMYVGLAKGDGVVVMTNSDNGFALIAEIIPTLGRLYGWPGYAPQSRHFVSVPVSRQRRLTGSFQAKDSYPFTIDMFEGHLQLRIAGGTPHKLLTSSALTLFETDNIMQLSFRNSDRGELDVGSQSTPFVRTSIKR